VYVTVEIHTVPLDCYDNSSVQILEGYVERVALKGDHFKGK
jgi:hypothetical protein